jgi:hypothetical protein
MWTFPIIIIRVNICCKIEDYRPPPSWPNGGGQTNPKAKMGVVETTPKSLRGGSTTLNG